MKKNLLLTFLLFVTLLAAQPDSGKSQPSLQDRLQALMNAKSAKDDGKISVAANSIGDFYASHEDFSNALQYYEIAFAAAKKLKSRSIMGESLANMGVIYQEQSKSKLAINVYGRAVEMYTMAGDNANIAKILNELGRLTLSSGNYKKSYKLYETANSKARKVQIPEYIAASYEGMATALQKMRQYKYAKYYHNLYETENAKIASANHDAKTPAQNTTPANTSVTVANPVSPAAKAKSIPAPTVKTISHPAWFRFNWPYMIAFAILSLFAMVVFHFIGQRNATRLKIRLAAETGQRELSDQERLATLESIHDDLHSGLLKIEAASEAILMNNSGNAEVQRNGQLLKDTTARLIGCLPDLIWVLKHEQPTIKSLADEIQQYAAEYFAQSAVQLKYEFPADLPDTSITKESYRALFMAVKETLHNVSKHSAATEVTVKGSLAQEVFLVSVNDNGNGFDMVKEKGDGLRELEARFEKMRGTFKLFSKPGHGSHVTAGFHLRNICVSV